MGTDSKRAHNFIDMTGWVMKEHGVPNSKLTVIEQRGRDKYNMALWLCRCECGKEIITQGKSVRHGYTLTCGNCGNKIVCTEDCCIVCPTNSDNLFYFDLEDYELLKQHTWSEHLHGYLMTHIKIDGKFHRRPAHRIILGEPDGVVDHIDRDKKNNRRSNLRVIDKAANAMNHSLPCNNTTGYCGVSYAKRTGKYVAYIRYKDKQISLGNYTCIEDAIAARRKAEKEYFGEYAPNWDDDYS